jgi:hypothetical protein
MPVDPRDLCVVADVKALMQKTGANAAAQDTLIQSLITRASIKIMRDYGREFVPGGVLSLPATAATRTFEYAWGDQYPGEAFVDFHPYDLQTVQTTPPLVVKVDTDQVATPITLSVEEWRLWPQPPSQGVFLAIKVLPLNMNIGLIGWRKRQLQVTGNWGFPTIPFEVTQACAETVIHWITSYPGARRVDQVDSGLPAITPRSYPMTAIDLLQAFKRMTV